MNNSIIELLKSHDELIEVSQELDIYLEVSHLAYVEAKKKDGGKAILFTNVKKKNKKFNEPVLMNVLGSKRRLDLIFETDINVVANELESILKFQNPTSFFDKFLMLKKFAKLRHIFPKKLKKRGENTSKTTV